MFRSQILIMQGLDYIEIHSRPWGKLQSSPYIRHPTSFPSGDGWEGRVLNKHMLNDITFHHRWGPMMSTGSMGLRESARQRTTHCVQFPFITSHKESQASRFYKFYPSSLLVSLRLELLFSLVVRSLSPLSCFSAIFLSQQTSYSSEEVSWICSMVRILTIREALLFLPTIEPSERTWSIHSHWGNESELCSSSPKEGVLQAIRLNSKTCFRRTLWFLRLNLM